MAVHISSSVKNAHWIRHNIIIRVVLRMTLIILITKLPAAKPMDGGGAPRSRGDFVGLWVGKRHSVD